MPSIIAIFIDAAPAKDKRLTTYVVCFSFIAIILVLGLSIYFYLIDINHDELLFIDHSTQTYVGTILSCMLNIIVFNCKTIYVITKNPEHLTVISSMIINAKFECEEFNMLKAAHIIQSKEVKKEVLEEISIARQQNFNTMKLILSYLSFGIMKHENKIVPFSFDEESSHNAVVDIAENNENDGKGDDSNNPADSFVKVIDGGIEEGNDRSDNNSFKIIEDYIVHKDYHTISLCDDGSLIKIEEKMLSISMLSSNCIDNEDSHSTTDTNKLFDLETLTKQEFNSNSSRGKFSLKRIQEATNIFTRLSERKKCDVSEFVAALDLRQTKYSQVSHL
jgi:hypothetical protein